MRRREGGGRGGGQNKRPGWGQEGEREERMNDFQTVLFPGNYIVATQRSL